MGSNARDRLAADSVRAISTERLIELIGAGVNGPAGQSYAAEARRRGLRDGRPGLAWRDD